MSLVNEAERENAKIVEDMKRLNNLLFGGATNVVVDGDNSDTLLTTTTTITSRSQVERRLELNSRYQATLRSQLEEINGLAMLNGEKQRVIQEILVRRKEGKELSLQRALDSPYFFDHRGMQPPSNSDMLAKKNLKPVPRVHKTNRWKKKEKVLLLEGILHQCRQRVATDFMERYRANMRNGITDMPTEDFTDDELLRSATNIDWEEIASKYVKTRTPLDCKIEWYFAGDPNINRSEWTHEEDRQLFVAAAKHQQRDWVSISRELDNGRTPLQCFMRFQRALNAKAIKSKWDHDSDEKLKALVAKHGDSNWVRIANEFDDRTDQQCLTRYHKSLNPNVRHGTFSPHEDTVLTLATHAYNSKNWSYISRHLPGRTDVKCRERYHNVLDPRLRGKKRTRWTQAEDDKLRRLARETRYRWSVVSEMFDRTRTDNQLSRHFRSIATPDELAECDGVRNEVKVKRALRTAGYRKEQTTLRATDVLPVLQEHVTSKEGPSVTEPQVITSSANTREVDGESRVGDPSNFMSPTLHTTHSHALLEAARTYGTSECVQGVTADESVAADSSSSSATSSDEDGPLIVVTPKRAVKDHGGNEPKRARKK